MSTASVKLLSLNMIVNQLEQKDQTEIRQVSEELLERMLNENNFMMAVGLALAKFDSLEEENGKRN